MAMAPSKLSTMTPPCSTSPCIATTTGTSFPAPGLLKRYSSWVQMWGPLGRQQNGTWQGVLEALGGAGTWGVWAPSGRTTPANCPSMQSRGQWSEGWR